MRKISTLLWLNSIVIVIVVVLLDQSTKLLVSKYFYNKTITIIPGVIDLNYSENSSGVFSIFRNIPDPIKQYVIFSTMSFTIILVTLLLIISIKGVNIPNSIAFSMILGGGIGNYIDVLRTGYAVDFIMLHYNYQVIWPIFNVADIFIFIGIVILSLWYLKQRKYIKHISTKEKPSNVKPIRALEIWIFKKR